MIQTSYCDFWPFQGQWNLTENADFKQFYMYIWFDLEENDLE